MELSLIEFAVYAIICYSGVIGLIYSAFKNGEAVQKDSLRNIWLLPSIVCAYILSNLNTYVNLDVGTTTKTITSSYDVLNATGTGEIVILNSTTTEVIANAGRFSLVDPIWVTVHGLFMIIMIIYVVVNIVTLLANIKKN